MSEFLPSYQSSAWFGFGAPKETSIEIVDRLNREIDAGLGDANVKAQLAELGVIVVPGAPTEFGKFIADETDKWGKLVKFAGVKAE